MIEAWRRRDQGDAATLLAWSIGTPTDTAAHLIADGFLTAPANVVAAANDDD